MDITFPRHAKTATFVLITMAFLAASLTNAHAKPSATHSALAQARAKFHTRLIAYVREPDPIPAPPAGVYNLVTYPTPLGNFPAYVSVPPTTGKRYPAIIWIVGGFGNSIGDTPWAPATPDNDQSANAFRQYGVVTMFPSLRGGNRNPGYQESFYGEVNDIIAAAKFLARQPFVDPNRIYLGGHSTGGTLALLTSECTDRFRAVFSFGPVSRITDYGTKHATFDYSNPKEVDLRSPILYLQSIAKPTYVMEGTVQTSNLESLNEMNAVNKNPRVHFFSIPGYDHFSELAAFTPTVAQWIVKDSGPVFRIPGSTSIKAGSKPRKH